MESHTGQGWLALSDPSAIRAEHQHGGQVTRLKLTALCSHAWGGHHDPRGPETPYSPEIT